VEHTLIAIDTEGDAEPSQELCGLTEAALRHVVTLTLAAAGIEQAVELSVLVTDDERLRVLNRDYRGRDAVTDVLSFPLLDAPLVSAPADELWGAGDENEDGELGDQRTAPVRESGTSVVSSGEWDDVDADGDTEEPLVFAHPPDMPPHLGDIVVARGMTLRQAAAAGHSPAYELAYLVAHGVLHLVGYDDHTDAGYAAMVRQQEQVLSRAGIAP
jgi:probable rRNA maturation factor